MDVSVILPATRELVQREYAAPEQAARLNDHAHDLAGRGKIAAAVVALRRARALAPDHPILMSCMGAVLFDACQYTEAEQVLRQAIAIEPEYAPSHGNLGSVLGAQGRYEEAHAAFRRAIAIEPDYSDARWNYALSLLDSGKWTEAWPYYEARKIRGGPKLYPALPYPEWRGQDLNGKTLYVQGEQGLGDRTLFSRYLVWVKRTWPEAKILFLHNAEDLPNVSNFMWAYRGIVEFIPNGVPWPEADYGTYLMSLPAIHGTTPRNVYPEPGLLLANARRHQKSIVLPKTDPAMLKVGIAWTGNPGMKRNGERTIPFELMLQLAELEHVVLFGLQFGSDDIARHGADQLICDLTNEIRPYGLTGTAVAMLNLDLVITSCTATAHIAGVLGVPCWVLVCANCYWLWLRGRENSVWYANTRLFRQDTMHDWSEVVQRVKAELSDYRIEQRRAA